ncbi:MAG TPA: RcpC/CpaB family pilus assembly protein [Streptosporangiaceae bacterium]
MACALSAVRPAAPRGVRVLAAARDLPSGITLRPSDVRPVVLPPTAVPDGAARTSLTGRVLAGPVRSGEPLTDVRLLDPGLLNGYGPGLVAVPIRMADAGAVRLLHPGDHIDVLAAATPPGDAPDGLPAAGSDAGGKPTAWTRPVASSVPVVAIPPASGDNEVTPINEPGDGALVVVAARRDQAATLAAFAGGARLTFVIVG